MWGVDIRELQVKVGLPIEAITVVQGRDGDSLK